MAEIRPFRAMMFGSNAQGDSTSLSCPPYDIISEEQRQALLERNPHNIIRLELPLGEDRYKKAGELLNQWRKDGVLTHDELPAIYLYGESFSVGGKEYAFTGIIARVKLEEFSAGVILPHEETLSKAKEDRFCLMEATGCNFSNIYTLYNDDAGENSTAKLVEALAKEEPIVCFTDEEEVTHRLWRVTDETVIARLQGQFAQRKLYIADGHHRYETALRYKNTRKNLSKDAAENDMMMFMVDMENDGLVVFPTHRVIHSLESFSFQRVCEEAQQHFTVSSVEEDRVQELLDAAYAKGDIAFALVAKEGCALLTYQKDGAIEALLPGMSDAYRGLDVTVLHNLILEQLLGIDKENMANQVNLSYTRSREEAVALAHTTADCAFLLNATRVSQIAAVAAAGEKMPQKSTYFYPKLITGLVMNDFTV